MKLHDNLRADLSRLWSTLMRSAEIGKTERGGVKRLALSNEDETMRRLFVQWCLEAGCSVTIDAVGNIFATRAGTDPNAKPVLVGSHLDTQVRGGRFDGILGVLAGLEIVRTLNDHGVATRHPVCIVNWTNEEGARFEPPMIGSAIFTGARPPEFAYTRADREGILLEDALRQIGFKGEDQVAVDQFDSLFELHIEQGPRLEDASKQVGIVTGAFGVRGLIVEIFGETGHVGPTPMPSRRNALVGAAHVTLAIDDIGWGHYQTGGKSTTMRIKAEPNLLGALPDYVEMTCDMRHPQEAVAIEMFDTFKRRVPELEERSRCRIAIKESWSYGGMRFDDTCVGLIRAAAGGLGYSTMELLTEAGHDAMHVAEYLPTAMIFTPCEGGLSHSEAENVTLEDIEPGVNVLLQAILLRAA